MLLVQTGIIMLTLPDLGSFQDYLSFTSSNPSEMTMVGSVDSCPLHVERMSLWRAVWSSTNNLKYFVQVVALLLVEVVWTGASCLRWVGCLT